MGGRGEISKMSNRIINNAVFLSTKKAVHKALPENVYFIIISRIYPFKYISCLMASIALGISSPLSSKSARYSSIIKNAEKILSGCSRINCMLRNASCDNVTLVFITSSFPAAPSHINNTVILMVMHVDKNCNKTATPLVGVHDTYTQGEKSWVVSIPPP